MKKRKVLIAVLLLCMAFQYGAVLPASAKDYMINIKGGHFSPSMSNMSTAPNVKAVAASGNTIYTEVDANAGMIGTEANGKLEVGGNVTALDEFTNKGTSNIGGALTSKKKFENTNETTVGSLDIEKNGESSNTNSGTLTITGENGEESNFNADFTNSGEIKSNGTLNNNAKLTNDGEGKFTNKGTLNNGKSGESASSAELSGNVTNDGGVIRNFGKITNDGTAAEDDGKGLQNQNGGTIYNEANGEIAGTVVNGEGGTIYNEADATIKGADSGSGSLFNQGGNVVNNGNIQSEINSTGGVITNNESGTIGVNEEPQLSIEGSNTTVNNFGNITGGIDLDNSTINNSGTIDLKDKELTNSGSGESGESTGDLIVNSSGTIKGGTIGSDDQKGNVVVNSTGTLGDESEGITIKGEKTTVNNEGKIDGTIKMENGGKLHLGQGTTYGDTYNFTVGKDSCLDAANGKFEDLSDHTTLTNGSLLASDLSMATGQTDVFKNGNSASFSPSPSGIQVTLEDFNIIPDTLNSQSHYYTKQQLKSALGFNGNDAVNYDLSIKEGISKDVLSPLRWFTATSDSNGISIAPSGNTYRDFNPAVMAAPIAAQIGGYLNQLNSYDEAFRNMDMYMLMTKSQRQALKNRNKYAASDSNLVFDPTNTPYDNTSAWFRPYANFENVKLKGGPKVSNVAWGSFFGVDSELMELGHGWDGMFGAYIGYNGSHQAYDGIGIYQNGATLGLVGMAYKDNYFAGLTANVGSNIASADSIYGSDDFNLLMSGVAAKTGYNWELADGRFIIQPSYTMSYSFVNTFDYTNAAGIRVNGDPLHAIAFEPGLKFIGNLNNGWQPYAGVSVVWNIFDKTDFTASDATLPELSVKPFVKYGIGIRKTWGERLTGFFQTFFTSGGRNGVGLQAGVRWTLGNKEPKHANSTGEKKYIKADNNKNNQHLI